MVNNSAKVIAVGALAAVGVLGLVSNAQAQHFKYPETRMVTEGSPSPIDWDSSPAPNAFEKTQQKMVYSCEPMGDGTYKTTATMVRETVNPDQYPVYTTDVLYESSTPSIVWTATLSSNNPDGAYTPESRCQTISARLTNLAYAFGATDPETVVAMLAERMSTGIVNGEKVVYISFDPENASSENVVFTLKPENGESFAATQRTLAQFQNGIVGDIGGFEDIEAEKLPPVVE